MLRRFWLPTISVAILSGCTIQETPQEYIDHLTTPAEEIEAAREELTDRLRSVAPALQREDRTSLSGALAPAADVTVIGPRPGQELRTPDTVVDSMIAFVRGSAVRTSGSEVSVGEASRIAWFRTRYTLSGGAGGEGELSFTGVFMRSEGEWRLAQGHLSTDFSQTPPAPVQEPAAPAGE